MPIAIVIKVGSLEAVKRAAPRALLWVAMRVYCAKPLLSMSKGVDFFSARRAAQESEDEKKFEEGLVWGLGPFRV